MKRVSIHEAKTHFSRLIAEAEAGEEIIVRRGPKPVARLIAYEPSTAPRTPGRLKGSLSVGADFDAPLEDFAEYE